MKKVFVQLESGRGYGRDLLKGICEYSEQFSGWEIIFEPAYYLKTTETRNIISMIELMKPDGCIFEHTGDVNELINLDIPFVQANWVERIGNFPCLKGNYEADGKIAAEYFLGLGFRNLAFFGIEKLPWSDGRLKSFQKHAENGGATFFQHKIEMRHRNETLNYNQDYLILWLKSLPKPVGVLCCNDDFGQILINACSIGGLKVPHEISVLGIDNDELLCNITYPNLSSIHRNNTKAAFSACEILNRMMNGEDVEERVVLTEPMNVVVRASTDTIACDDAEVIKALYYIRNNIHKPINVSNVVGTTYISRRSLYSRFKEVTGHTINEEIQFQKLKKFKELLQNKNLSVKEVSFRLGFDNVSHVSRWFSSIEGIPPIKWRNENF